ncbi:MAG: pantoate--beta-alanine ligase [Actinobacteria bacterium]|nr:pantoate--beta-alanine ligase [Actinomycetota bacterium]
MELTTTFSETRDLSVGRVGLVPTMGFFHEGHLSLMRLVRDRCDTLIVSNFVNPTQFDRENDLEEYPRDLDRDRAMAVEVDVDIFFEPELGEVYPEGASTIVDVPGVSHWMEGRHRPGHFAGVATVVAKLFAGIQPDSAVFGRKDAQQLAVIEAMVRDLRFPVEILAAPLVRESDGLALSSRNVHLSAADRESSLAISRGLFQAAEQIDAGEVRGERLEATVARSSRSLTTEYVTLSSLETMVPIATLDQPAVLAVAAQVGSVRLIDNIVIDFEGGRPVPDRGLILDEPSRLGTLP